MIKIRLFKKISLLIICMICIFSLSGCWDKHELEDNTYIVFLGIDKSPSEDLSEADDNKNDNGITVTVSFPLTQAESGGGESSSDKGSSGEYSVMSVKAPTIAEGLNLLGTKLSGPIALYTVKTIVVSRELAESDMLKYLFSTWRYEQIRSTSNILITDCKAADFIAARVKDSPIDPLRQEDLLLEQNNNNACYKPVQFLELIANSKSNSTDGIAMYGEIKSEEIPVKAENKTWISGLAVFRGPKMAGTLDPMETQVYSMLTQSKSKKVFTFPDPLDSGSNITVEIMPTCKNKIKSSFNNGIPVFDIGVNLKCTVECVQSGVDYTLPQNYNILAEYIKGECTKNMQNLITKVQKEYDADILKLGNKLAYRFATENEWENYNWSEKYKDAEINLNVKLDITRTGTLLP